jgi:hypothetical protein
VGIDDVINRSRHLFGAKADEASGAQPGTADSRAGAPDAMSGKVAEAPEANSAKVPEANSAKVPEANSAKVSEAKEVI